MVYHRFFYGQRGIRDLPGISKSSLNWVMMRFAFVHSLNRLGLKMRIDFRLIGMVKMESLIGKGKFGSSNQIFPHGEEGHRFGVHKGSIMCLRRLIRKGWYWLIQDSERYSDSLGLRLLIEETSGQWFLFLGFVFDARIQGLRDWFPQVVFWKAEYKDRKFQISKEDYIRTRFGICDLFSRGLRMDFKSAGEISIIVWHRFLLIGVWTLRSIWGAD